MSQPLAGLHLWVARPQDELAPSVARFVALGARAEGLPLVERIDVGCSDAQLRALPAGATVVLASAHAARRWVECVDRHPPLAALVAAVVGERAAEVLAPRGIVVGPRGTTAAGLLGHLEGPGPFVLAGSADRRPELPGGLRARGAEVVELDLYRTGPGDALAGRAQEQWNRERPDAVALYSPSGARALRGLQLDGMSSVALLAIGPTTAGCLRELGLEVAATGEPAGEEGLVSATRRWWEDRR